MTADLRSVHSRAVQWMGISLLVCLVLAASGYRIPVTGEIPPEAFAALPTGAELEHSEESEFEGSIPIRIEIFKVPVEGAVGAHKRWVRVTFLQRVRQPDLMVYWSSKSSTYEEPPLGSFLIGVMDPRRPQAFPLPQQADFLRGYLVIYSLGQRVLITQALLPQPF